MDIEKAVAYATCKHEGQTRKNGTPYIHHPLAVALFLKNKGFDDEYIVTGLFHDLLEDTDATEDEILELSDERVLRAVKLLTKTGDEKDYVKNILTDPIAKEVKNADRIHNLTEAMDGTVDFARRYTKNTREKYLGKFSRELDEAYANLLKRIDSFEYTIDASADDASPIYRTSGDKAWIFNTVTGIWEETDPFFWAELEENATRISEERARQIVKMSI